MLEQSYTSNPSGSPSTGRAIAGKDGDYWDLPKLRRAYTDYLFSKRQELDEQQDARRYYHGAQWTTEQIQTMKKRKQPVMTFNRVARKIDGVVGLIEKLRQDPKAYARTPQHEQGADLATATLRYVLDEQQWKSKSPIAASDGAIDGIGGIELEIIQGDHGDPDVGFELVDIQSFFYDPRSYREDFSDARYMGVGKWLDIDVAKEMFPDADFNQISGNDYELINNSDRDMRWFSTSGVNKRVRVVDCWYQHQGGWCFGIFTGNSILMKGKSYLKDEKKKDLCKYIMFAGNVDQDGDKYGFIRNMKSAQDGINARQSKMQHILASRRLILSQGAVDDVEKVRREWARPDGVVVTNRPVNEGVKADDQSFDFAGWTKMLELNLQEIENYGPNPQLLGQRDGAESGRAIALLQQAGMAELGPYIMTYRGWKIRVYRAIWNAVQQHWKAERWIRVTDDQDVAQFVQINGLQIDPQTGQPTLTNAIGSLDVDIVIDEGPDSVTTALDDYDALQVLAGKGVMVPPQALIELAPISSQRKKRINQILDQAMQNQPQPVDPGQAKMAEVQLNGQIAAAELQQNAQLKEQELNQTAALKQKEMEQEWVFEAARHNRETEMARAKHERDTSIALEKHDTDRAIATDKHNFEKQNTVDKLTAEQEVKTKTSEKEAAPLKKVAGELVDALTEIAGTIKESIEAPRKIVVARKDGVIVGGESRVG